MITTPDVILELRRLVDLYARTMDDRDEETLAGLFAPGGKLTIQGRRTSEFVAPSGFGPIVAAMERYASTFYVVTQHIVDAVGAGRASGETYSIGSHLEDGARGRVIVNPIRYRDSYVMVAGSWRFEERVATILWTETREGVRREHGATG
jgi:hypothetical protein